MGGSGTGTGRMSPGGLGSACHVGLGGDGTGQRVGGKINELGCGGHGGLGGDGAGHMGRWQGLIW